MMEDGRVFSVSDTGSSGLISPLPPSVSYPAVTYDHNAVVGRLPRNKDRVCFVRISSASSVATRVQVGSCAAIAEADQLNQAFLDKLAGVSLTTDGAAEVARLSADRARRILKAKSAGSTLPDDVIRARRTLAIAAMELTAIESSSLSSQAISADTIRSVLRAQRPRLPRK